MTPKYDREAYLHNVLYQIASYADAETIRADAPEKYGLEPEEAIEMAYENVIEAARHAIKEVENINGENE